MLQSRHLRLCINSLRIAASNLKSYFIEQRAAAVVEAEAPPQTAHTGTPLVHQEAYPETIPLDYPEFNDQATMVVKEEEAKPPTASSGRVQESQADHFSVKEEEGKVVDRLEECGSTPTTLILIL